MEPQLTCPYCGRNFSLSDYFCPDCGKNLKDKPQSTTFTKQLSVYLISVFLPPLGIWPAIKYLRGQDKKSKRIGLIALLLTLISTVVTGWLTINFINSLNQQLGNQLNTYQGF
jgi:predicted amidophosphoribosyltransferase